MQHLFQSTFLQALGYAIANSLWQTALAWLIYISATGLLSLSAAAKYRLAVAAQAIGFVWFIITFRFYYQQYNAAWDHATAVPVSQNIRAILSSNTDLSSRLINLMVKGEQLLPYISMAYLLLMLFLCIRWFLGYRQTQLIRNNGLQKMPGEWRLFVKKIAAQLGIKKEIRIFLSNTISTPLTIGFWKPVILIPVASINHLTVDQLEAVLLHELAHIKRYDYLVNIILSVIEISLFFNPFTQLLSKSIRKERENSCDDWVLQFKYNASVYAEALLRIAYLQSAPVFAMAATGKKNELLTRVKRIIDKKENRFNYRKQLLAFVIVTGILSSVAWLNPIAPHTSKDQQVITAENKSFKKTTRSYAVEPMAVNIDNPLFNPVFFLSKPLKAEMKKNIASAQKEIDDTVFTDNDGTKLFSEIPTLITGAMKQASAALNEKEIDWKNEMADMELSKTEMDKAFHTDSSLLPLKLRRKIKDDFNLSLKDIDAAITNAKTEMQRAASKQKTDVAFFDKAKVEQDLERSMQTLAQLGKMSLDKMVLGALRVPEIILDDNGQHMKIHTKQPPELPKEPHERMRNRIMLAPGKELPSKQRMPAEDPDEIKTEEPNNVPEVILPLQLSTEDLEKIKKQLINIIWVKALTERKGEEFKVKIIPAIVTEKNQDERKQLVLRIQ